jgi:glycosyltransferase involved in cell wall biosynthesis
MNYTEKLTGKNLRQKIYFTSINLEYLDKAITLWESLKIFETKAQFVTVIVEPELTKFQLEDQLKALNFPFDLSKPLLVHDVPWNWIEKLDGLSVVEACTAIKASAAKFLLASSLDTQVVYLDPDMQVYGPLNEVDNLLELSSFVLTPHLLEPPSIEESVISNEIAGSMVHGVYNLGFFAVKNTREGFEILNWWESRLSKYCKAETSTGVFTDQKWFDISTIYFNSISILKHPGYNVAPWNLAERFLTNENGLIRADNFPLKIFHFSSFDYKVHIEMLVKFDSSKIALNLARDYKKALERNAKYKLSKIQSLIKSKETEKISVNRLLKNVFIRSIEFIISLLLRNRVAMNLLRKIPRQVRSSTNIAITSYINKNLERPRRKFTQFDQKIAIPPKWILVTHIGGGGAEQILRSVSKFLNITNSSDGIVVYPEPEWVQVRLLSGSILYEAKNDEFKKLVTNWIRGGSKVVINHIQGHEWWLSDIEWESVKPIVLVHDRAFLRKSIFDPYVGKDLVSIEQRFTSLISEKNEVWQANWLELITSAEIILAPSKWIKLEMQDAFPKAKIIHFPWFDSSDLCELPTFRVTTSPTVIGVIGAVNEHKGIRDLAEAARISLENNFDVRFVVFGNVSTNFKHLLKAENIITVGQVRRSRLKRALRDYGVSIIWHCSNVQETFSLALSDNIYSGIPLIAKNGGAYSERIFARDKSWLYDPQIDVQDLVEFFSSPNSKEHKSIFPAKNNQLLTQNDDDMRINIFIHKYSLTDLLWLSMLGF